MLAYGSSFRVLIEVVKTQRGGEVGDMRRHKKGLERMEGAMLVSTASSPKPALRRFRSFSGGVASPFRACPDPTVAGEGAASAGLGAWPRETER